MNDQRLSRIFVVMMVVGAVIGLGGLWWWAILGMSESIGIALMVTSMAFGIVGGIGLTVIFANDRV